MPEQVLLPEEGQEVVSTTGPTEAVYDDTEGPEVEDTEEEPTDEVEEPKAATVESVAAELGWKPKEGFVGNEEDYVDAAEYIRRSKDIQESMRQSLKENRRKMIQMEKMVEDLKSHTQAVYRAEIKDLKSRVESVQKARDEAIEEGDKERVYQMDKELGDLRSEVQSHLTRAMQDSQKQPEPEFDEREISTFKSWTQQNNWYRYPGAQTGDAEMTKYADYLADLPEYAGLPYERKLMAVTDIVKQRFPDKFGARTPAAPRVESGRPSGMKKTYSARDLTAEQRSIMKNFVKQGVMSEKDYINDLVKIGELR